MTRAGGVLDAFPGRVTVRVPIPGDLLAEAGLLAEERGADLAVIFADLVAAALPDALAEAARDLLSPSLDATAPPDMPAALRRGRLYPNAGSSLPPGRRLRTAAGRGSTT